MSDSDSSGSSCDAVGAVEVAVQLSRFHMETIESSAAGDVDVRGLTLTVGDHELLTDAHLALRRGTRYGLVGRNGTGKSTLLKACANKSIPGLPRDMKILYVQQDNVPGDDRSALQTVLDAGSARGALAKQIAALEAALEWEEDGERDGGDGPGGRERASCQQRRLVEAVRGILAARADVAAEEAEQIAARRSRARGKEAIKCAVAAREQAKKTQEEQLTADKAASLAPQLLADLYDSLDQLGGREDEETRAAEAALRGLGFSEEQCGEATVRLSGGWRMRVALACALLARPHLLLLDEPTNHLDLLSILWLQDYLSHQSEGVTVGVVSHDRAFLNAVAQETVVLREGRLQYFPGTYAAYVQARAEAALHKERQMAGQERHRAHLENTIARAERAARVAGDDKRLLQAASRRKKIDRLGAEKTADGKKFKVSYWVGYHDTLRPQVELDRPEEPVILQLPPPEIAVRQLGPLLQLRDVTVAYGSSSSASASSSMPVQFPDGSSSSGTNRNSSSNASSRYSPATGALRSRSQLLQARPGKGKSASGGAATTAVDGGKCGVARPQEMTSSSVPSPPGASVVLRGVTVDVEGGARIGLLGLNGSGKSSLMRVMAGALAPAAGEVVSPCPRLIVAYLDQHSGRRLVAQEARRVHRGAADKAAEGPGERQAQQGGSAAAGRAGASGPACPATAFSAVQARAPHMRQQEVYDYLGKFAVPGPLATTPLAALSGGQRCRVALALEMLARPHLLLLDEPTNHLDLLTVQALAAAIRAWEGAVVIASHDLAFLQDTCHEVWVVEGGEVARQPQPEVADAIEAYAGRLRERLRKRVERLRRQVQS